MAKLHELKRKRSELAESIRAKRAERRTLKAELRTKLEELPVDGEPSPEMKDLEGRVDQHDKDIDSLQAQHDQHDGRIDSLERAMEEDGDDAKPSDDEGDKSVLGDLRLTPYGKGEPTPRTGKGYRAARFAMGMIIARTEGKAVAAAEIERQFGDKEVAKALNTTGVATGGALIPQAFSNEIIELLRAETVIRQCEPTIYQMPGGNLTIPRLQAGATAGYQGELDDISASQETFDDLQLNAKKLTALVPVSNDLIRRAPANIEAIVRDDLVQTLARREDLAFLLGDGSGTSPIGLLNLCAAMNKLTVLAFSAPDNATILTAVVGVLLSMRLSLKNNFSRMIRPRWISDPTFEAFLMGLRDQVGNFVYKDEMMQRGTLDGIPYKTTQQLPNNIATASGNNGSYLFLADFADVILAETLEMRIDASDVASYRDSGGNTVSTFTRDQTAFRVIEEHDFNLRHQGSVAVAVLPAWAPAGYSGYGPGGAYYLQAPSGDGSAAPSTWGIPPTGSNNPGNANAVAPGGTLPGRP